MTGPRTYNPADWKPGDVALFRVERWSSAREWPNDTSRVAMRLRKDGYWAALKGDPAAPFVVHAKSEYLHPLVELDPESDEDVERLRKEYDHHLAASAESGTYVAFLCSTERRTAAIRAALRAMTRPPKPDEPTGDTAVVVDRSGRVWHSEGSPTAGCHRWWSGAVVREWDALDVPPDGVRFGGVS